MSPEKQGHLRLQIYKERSNLIAQYRFSEITDLIHKYCVSSLCSASCSALEIYSVQDRHSLLSHGVYGLVEETVFVKIFMQTNV